MVTPTPVNTVFGYTTRRCFHVYTTFTMVNYIPTLFIWGYDEEINCYWIGLAKIKYHFQGTSFSKEGLLFASYISLNSTTENGEE